MDSSRQSNHGEDGDEGYRLQTVLVCKLFSSGQERKGVKSLAVGIRLAGSLTLLDDIDRGSGFWRRNCGEGSLGATTLIKVLDKLWGPVGRGTLPLNIHYTRICEHALTTVTSGKMPLKARDRQIISRVSTTIRPLSPEGSSFATYVDRHHYCRPKCSIRASCSSSAANGDHLCSLLQGAGNFPWLKSQASCAIPGSSA